MQELLTGKRRLPGFSGEWVVFNLTQNSKLKARIGWQGLTTKEYLAHGYAILITGTDFLNGNICWNRCNYVEKQRFIQDPNIKIENGDVLITKDGTIGKIAYVSNLPRPATLNSGIFLIRPLSEKRYSSQFVFYILSSYIFEEFLNKLSAGSTINHLYQKDFTNFVFYMPPTYVEATTIAALLSEMDSEIEQLTVKLTKVRLIKQGMMQELLTGRIRLINSNAESMVRQKAKAESIVPQEPVAVSKGHNEQFDDAVAFAAIVDTFYSDKYTLGRVKTYKLLYLLRRRQEAEMTGFKKMAAGPYKSDARYKGGENIAIEKGYIVEKRQGEQGFVLSKGKNIAKGLQYAQDWHWQANIQWLLDNFKFSKTKDLEVLATVDMAMCELREARKPVTLSAIKDVLRNNKEWMPKLEKDYFNDTSIENAIAKSTSLFD